MSRSAFVLLLAFAALAGGVLAPATARGDGDPASDVLVSQSMFLPYDTGVSGARQARLQALLTAAAHAGFPIRVALIPSEYDLGSVGVLWRNPRTYARFLGIELSLTYGNRVLVVMPDGLGFDWPHHGAAAAYRALAKIKIGRGGSGMLAAAEAAVRRLAAAAGVNLAAGAAGKAGAATPNAAGAGAGSRNRTTGTGSALVRLLFALLVLAIVIALAASLLIFVRDLRRDERSTEEPREGSAVTGGGQPGGVERRGQAGTEGERRPGVAARRASRELPSLRPRVLGAAAALCVCAAVPVALLTAGGHGAHARGAASRSAPEETPTTWSQGQRVAPNFELTDQRGHGVSLDAYRGRPVLVTFIDPLCRNQCPLAAKILSEADRRLPAAQRPEIIAVSVDVYADSRADLHEDYSRWSLVPQWQWAVGSPRQLAAVWKRYYAEVEVETKRIAGTTVHYITHSEMAYLVDGEGYERALFSWPFSEREVEAAVRGLGRS